MIVDLDRVREVVARCANVAPPPPLPLPSPPSTYEETTRDTGRTSERPPIPTLEERALRLGCTGPRLTTGLPTIDAMTRGGFPMGKRLTLTGAPGACKTGLALVLAARWARDGVHVGVHCADEDADGALIRLGQSEGLARELLENGNEEARSELARIVRDRYPTLLLVDQDEDRWTIEDLVEALWERAGDSPKVLVADSFQMLRTRESGLSTSRREELDAVVRRVKALSVGMLLVVTSEMNRSGYRNRNQADNAVDLASAAETRAIEYQSTTMITLRSVADEGGELVEVCMPKNRLGRKSDKPICRLKWDFARATLVEVGLPDEEECRRREVARLGQARELVVQALLREAPQSKRRLVTAVGRKRDDVYLAVDQLVEGGRIESIGRAGYRVVPNGPPVVPGTGSDCAAPPNGPRSPSVRTGTIRGDQSRATEGP